MLHADLTDDVFRARHVGAAEVSALFGANPWVTHFELWHRKNGTISTPDFGGNERIEWGIKLEPVIIAAACERWGYERSGLPIPRMSNGKGLGGHPDAIVNCPERGRGILETKCVDWLVVKQWGDEPPLHYLLQGNTYAGLDSASWFDLVVLVGGNELRRFQYDFRSRLFDEAERRTVAFWQSIEAGTPPPADYTRDRDPICEVYRAQGDDIIDLTGDNLMPDAAARYLRAKEQAKGANEAAEAAEAELRDKLGTAAAALVEGYSVKTTPVAATPDKTITADMVGTTLKGRKGYRRLYVKEKN
jgi:predicted phage-related endonuclease